MITQIFDSFISITISYWNNPMWADQISSTYIARVIATIWLSIIITVYLKYIEEEFSIDDRKAFDIVFAFMGSYKKTKALEENLVEWEDRYQMVVENTSNMIFIADRSGTILDVNSATLKYLNYLKKESLLGKSFLQLSETFRILPCLWEKVWNMEKHAIDDIIKSETKQIAIMTKDDKVIDIDIAFSKAFFKRKPVLIIFCRNVTERNKLIREKTELKEQLYHAQRVESLGRLAGGISHEFNNLLHAMQGHIDTTLIFGKVKDETDRKHLESVMGLVDKASNITSQLLGFARKREFRDKIVDLRKILQDTEDIFLPMAKGSIDFKLVLPEYECQVNADPVQLQQVYLNLMINAMDAMNSKDSDNKKLEVVLIKNKEFPKNWKPLKADAIATDYYLVTVTDNGEGMDQNVISKIFEPFFTTKEVGKGTGMGLSMVYGEITNYKGFIHVNSTKNIGTTFYVFLPIYKDEK